MVSWGHRNVVLNMMMMMMMMMMMIIIIIIIIIIMFAFYTGKYTMQNSDKLEFIKNVYDYTSFSYLDLTSKLRKRKEIRMRQSQTKELAVSSLPFPQKSVGKNITVRSSQRIFEEKRDYSQSN